MTIGLATGAAPATRCFSMALIAGLSASPQLQPTNNKSTATSPGYAFISQTLPELDGDFPFLFAAFHGQRDLLAGILPGDVALYVVGVEDGSSLNMRDTIADFQPSRTSRPIGQNSLDDGILVIILQLDSEEAAYANRRAGLCAKQATDCFHQTSQKIETTGPSVATRRQRCLRFIVERRPGHLIAREIDLDAIASQNLVADHAV